jgi:deoxycytidine triphosphate deaminase
VFVSITTFSFKDSVARWPHLPGRRKLTPEEIQQRLTGGVFSDWEIKRGLAEDQIVISPYDERRVQNSSVDVTLAESFCAIDEDRANSGEIVNMFDPACREWYFRPFQACTHQEKLEELKRSVPLAGVPLDAKVAIMEPGERLLGHTQEEIGVRYGGTTQMQAKSTTGRWGAGVCLDAGWGDEGYVSQWTMELINMNRKHRILLVVGQPIAQIVMYKMLPSSREYTDGGHYASRFGPTTMIPRVLTARDL